MSPATAPGLPNPCLTVSHRARTGSPSLPRPRGSSPRGKHMPPTGALKAALTAHATSSSNAEAAQSAGDSGSQPLSVDDASAGHAEQQSALLLGLPTDAMEAILLRLRPHDIVNCARVCHALRRAAHSEGLWQTICERQFDETCPRAWLVPRAEDLPIPDASSLFATHSVTPAPEQGSTPTTYRCQLLLCRCSALNVFRARSLVRQPDSDFVPLAALVRASHPKWVCPPGHCTQC